MNMSFTDSIRKATGELRELRLYTEDMSLQEIHRRADLILMRFVPQEVINAYKVLDKDVGGFGYD